MELKETLNLPQTTFPMKGNLPTTEPVQIEWWEKNQIYSKLQAKNKSKSTFTLPDGPPYANGDIHIGHVLNKCLKDFVIKYKSMVGFRSEFIPGWDCHGLPIEHKVTKDLGPKRREKSDQDLRELCRAEAQKWVSRQMGQFKRLGILARWDEPYLTMHAAYEAEEVRELGRCLDNGLLYQGNKPVYWCPALQTALAEAEVEYQNHKSPAVYVKFAVTGKSFGPLQNLQKPAFVMIWTTTPWTLPSNQGVALHPDFEYAFYESEGELLFVACELAESISKNTGKTLTLASDKATGSHFENLKVQHPFYDRTSLVILGNHVTLEAGTGCVHTAPGHGQDDYIVGLRYGLKVLSPIDAAGKFTDEVPEYLGTTIWNANPIVVERLRENGRLFFHQEIEHSYPHNWRSKTPLIFRATKQWFLSVDKEDNSIRKKALDSLNEIQFVPQWGRARLVAMIENRPDWCLSRQRVWGVPIPVFDCTKCETTLVEKKIFNQVADLMEKGRGIDEFYLNDISLFTSGYKCEKCGSTEFKRGRDILDVWFDSGVCHAAVQAKREGLTPVADLYLEGSDQHRGWFQTSLLSSIAAHGRPPFKKLLTHGFVTDPKGRKMSKSLGNVIDPADISNKSGSEILRLWAAYEDFGQDVGCGQDSFARVTETYRRFRNTMRYLLGNLNDFDPAKDEIKFEQMLPLDQWAMSKLQKLISDCRAAFDGYEFYKAYHALNLFFTVDLSATYLDILKDRLYTASKKGIKRRSAQTALYHILQTTLKLMAPITSFLSEETYQHFPSQWPRSESIFLADYPTENLSLRNEKLETEFERLIVVRSLVQKQLESLRNEKVIGASLDAAVKMTLDPEHFPVAHKYQSLLQEMLIVSQVHLTQGAANLIEVSKASGDKCERCWTYSLEIGQNKKYPTVCPKCSEALIENEI